MRTHKKFIPYLYAFIASIIPVVLFIFLVNPATRVDFFGIKVGAPLFLFFLIFISLFFLFTFIFANKRRGILSSCFFDGILILRFFGLTSIFQVIVLLTIVLLIEYLLSRRDLPPIKKLV